MPRQRSLLQQSLIHSTQDIGGRVVRGAGYKFLGMGLRTVITIATTAWLARLLKPADFGYVAMATVITEFAALFGRFGFTDVLVQQRVVRRLQLDTVFWVSQAIGVTLTLVVFLMSFATQWIFGDVRVGPLLQLLSLIFMMNSLSVVPSVVMSRLMRFRAEFWIQNGIVVSRAAVAVGAATVGWGAWSLVVGSVVGAWVSVVLHFAVVPYWPRLRFQAAFLAKTWKTSSFYFAGGLLYYVNMSFDLIMVGRQLGATAIGVYQNARSLTDEVRARIAAPLQSILFPAFSSLQALRSQQQYLFMRAARLLAALIFPVGFGVSAMAADLVPLLYGPQWTDMIPLVSIFGLSAALRGSTAISSPLLNSLDRVGLVLNYNIANTVVMVVGVMIALPFGVQGVAVAVALASILPLVTYRVGIGVLGLKAPDMLKILGPPMFASGAMWLVIAACRFGITDGVAHPLHRLLIHACAAAVVYVAVLGLLSRQHLRDALDATKTLLRRA